MTSAIPSIAPPTTSIDAPDTLTVVGPTSLHGTVPIQGFKHALVTCVAAAAACNGPVRLHNCPQINETRVLSTLIERLGGICRLDGTDLTIDATLIRTPHLRADEFASIHGSVYLLPALLMRFGEVIMPPTGGCRIGAADGARPVAQYADVLRRFGARVRVCGDGSLHVSASRLEACTIDLLDFVDDRRRRTGPLYSGATKTAILAAALSHGVSTIEAPYAKPDVTELISLLRTLGVPIETGTAGAYRIEGANGLLSTGGAEHSLIPDLIEIVTWTCAGALSADRPMHLVSNRMDDACAALLPELKALSRMGVNPTWSDRECIIGPVNDLSPAQITVTSPTIFSDSQPLLAVLAAHARGTSTITETVWAKRFTYAGGLAALGFDVSASPPTLTLSGGGARRQPTGPVRALDLRSAASLLLAALTLPNTTTLHGMAHLARGYANLPRQLIACGANLTTEDPV